MKIAIPRTLKLVQELWAKAEQSLQDTIKSYSPASQEEEITRLFHIGLAAVFDKANEQRSVERAFVQDIEAAIAETGYESSTLPARMSGLQIDAILHHKGTEGITGGDLGLVLSRPKMEISPYGQVTSIRISNHRVGLLAQAKLKDGQKKWRELTDTQIAVLPDRLSYSALLLYEYSDVQRRRLKPFNWQSLRSATNIGEVSSWLKAGVFPASYDSRELITKLDTEQVGTSSHSLINKYIAVASNNWLEVIIDWPDGKGPGSSVEVHSRYESQVEQKLNA